MTVSTETTKSATVVGNGVTTAFPFAFKIFQTSDVSVVLAVVATGVETVLTEGVDYSVSMNADQEADPGGEVTYPLSGSPMASTHSLTLVRDVPATQGLDLTLGGSFNPDNIEKALDRVTTLVQQLKEAVDRAVKVSVSSGLIPDEFFLDNIENAEANANAAAASAAAALASEVAAVAAAEDFLSRYVGASATDPTVDGNGDALTEGDLYWNTAVPEFRVYRSGAWVAFLDPGAIPVTPFAETLLDDTSAAAARATLDAAALASINIFSESQMILREDSTSAAYILRTYASGGSGYLALDRARGSVASPAVPQAGDHLGTVVFHGWDGSKFQMGTQINGAVHASGDFSPTNLGSVLEFYTVSYGSTAATQRLTIGEGLYLSGAGGDMGNGTFNATEYYRSGVTLVQNSLTASTVRAPSVSAVNTGLAAKQDAPYTGSYANNEVLPLGSIVLCYDSGAVGYARHSVVPVKYASANTFFFTTGTGVPLTGTWRSRGYLYTNSPTNTENYVLCQRVA